MRQLIPASNRTASPLAEMAMVQGFSGRHPGVDLAATGDRAVRASWNGRVVIADPCSARNCIDRSGERGPEFNAGYGNVVVVEYPSWSIPGKFRETLGLRSTESVYVLAAHLQAPADVHVGDIVTAGQELGTMGSTGNSSGTHLHLEIRVGLTGELADGQMCVGQACYDETRRRSQYDVTSPLARFGEWYFGMRAVDPELLRGTGFWSGRK
jgi:murein DD-endopeptidase MepM/ murein hydrolase activator NlpD